MKTKIFLLLSIISAISFAFSLDIIDDISAILRSPNPKALSKYFVENIDLKIIDKEDVYSKQQAEMILKDFFAKHPVKAFTVGHKSATKNGSQYVIGSLETTNGKFRTYFLLKTSGSEMLIQQFRIETENE